MKKNNNLTLFNNEKDSGMGSFKDFYYEVMVPMFGMMEVTDAAHLIGINAAALTTLLKECPKTISDDTANGINYLISIIDSMVEDEEFKDKVKSKIYFVKDHGIINFDDNRIIGSFEGIHDKYSLNIVIENGKIKFSSTNVNLIQSGEFGRTRDGKVYIKYSDIKTRIYKDVDKDGRTNKKYDSYKIDTKLKSQIFDADGIQTFEFNQEKNERYFLNKKTGDHILANPDCGENYFQKEYKMRAPENNIIKRCIYKYFDPRIAESPVPLTNYDTYSIGKNVCPDERTLPSVGMFYPVNNELFEEYMAGECDVNKIWENRGGNYQKRLNG